MAVGEVTCSLGPEQVNEVAEFLFPRRGDQPVDLPIPLVARQPSIAQEEELCFRLDVSHHNLRKEPGRIFAAVIVPDPDVGQVAQVPGCSEEEGVHSSRL